MTGLLVNAKQTSVALKKVKIMMTDEEFSNLTKTLFQFGLDDGDVGYLYWTSVINDLKELRTVYLAQIASAITDQEK